MHYTTWSRCAIASLALTISSAHAQWVVTDLHPSTAGRHSTGYAVGQGQQGGAAWVGTWPGGNYHATYWNSAAASWIDLHPTAPNAFDARSIVQAVSPGRQAGFVEGVGGGPSHASLWTGTAASWIDLNPVGYHSSTVYSMDANTQVGTATPSTSPPHAGLWQGSSASWVDLHPTGMYYSYAFGASGNRQVGAVGNFAGGFGHATMWSSTAASMVDLHPAGHFQSAAYGISGNQQVGQVDSTAALWTNTASSYVNLEPAAANGSLLNATDGTRQVGWANINNRHHAGIWSATAASFVDLHNLLPAKFAVSEARSIWSDANGIYVLGEAQDSSNSSHAILWTLPVPSPATALVPAMYLLVATRRRRT